MDEPKKRISELPEEKHIDGLFTIGVNKEGRSVKVPVDLITGETVGFAGYLDFTDSERYQEIELAQGWYTFTEGLYAVDGVGFSGLLLITKAAKAHQDESRNVIIDSKPSFFFVGNAKFVTYDKADTDIIKDVAKGDGFSVYTSMEATNHIRITEFDGEYWISEFIDIGDAFNYSKKAVEWMNKINQGWQNWQGLTNEKKLDNLPGYVFAASVSGNTGMLCTPTVDSIRLTLPKRDLNAGRQEEVGWKILAATNEKAGVMTAEDKQLLIRGVIDFADQAVIDKILQGKGWYTYDPGIYYLKNDAYLGILCIARSAKIKVTGDKLEVEGMPDFFIIGNVTLIEFDGNDPKNMTGSPTHGSMFNPRVYAQYEDTCCMYAHGVGTDYCVTDLYDLGFQSPTYDVIGTTKDLP